MSKNRAVHLVSSLMITRNLRNRLPRNDFDLLQSYHTLACVSEEKALVKENRLRDDQI